MTHESTWIATCTWCMGYVLYRILVEGKILVKAWHKRRHMTSEGVILVKVWYYIYIQMTAVPHMWNDTEWRSEEPSLCKNGIVFLCGSRPAGLDYDNFEASLLGSLAFCKVAGEWHIQHSSASQPTFKILIESFPSSKLQHLESGIPFFSIYHSRETLQVHGRF